MPELPDLVYITEQLAAVLPGARIVEAAAGQPVVLRNTFDRLPGELLAGRSIDGVDYRGPFLRLALEGELELIFNLMLAGRLHLQRPGEREPGYRCLSLTLAGGLRLHLCDEQKMAKAYLVGRDNHRAVPGFDAQGVDILSAAFTPALLHDLVRRHGRRQVRVLINDHTLLSSIGNAYADEILFEAGIHPKTLAGRLSGEEVERLYGAVRSVMAWAVDEVRRAGQPIHIKVRDHLRVRNRHGEPCPRCGTTIRREGVRGYDVFYCPSCQPPTRRHFIDWRPEARGPTGGGGTPAPEG